MRTPDLAGVTLRLLPGVFASPQAELASDKPLRRALAAAVQQSIRKAAAEHSAERGMWLAHFEDMAAVHAFMAGRSGVRVGFVTPLPPQLEEALEDDPLGFDQAAAFLASAVLGDSRVGCVARYKLGT